jgi:hypothetical protein
MNPEEQESDRARSEGKLIQNLTLEGLRSEVRMAVSEGIASAMTQDAARAFWGVGIEMLQEQATRRAGRFVLDGALFALKRIGWASVALLAVYMLGGWQFVVLAWKAIIGGARP